MELQDGSSPIITRLSSYRQFANRGVNRTASGRSKSDLRPHFGWLEQKYVWIEKKTVPPLRKEDEK